jgi:hypothetical protein
VKYSNDQYLSIGVLQGDTLAPYLFVIVVDYVAAKVSAEYNQILFLHAL